MADNELQGSKLAKIKVRKRQGEMAKPETGGTPEQIKVSSAYKDTMKKFATGDLVKNGRTVTNRQEAVRIAVAKARAYANR